MRIFGLSVSALLVLAVPAVIAVLFSDFPRYRFNAENRAALIVSFKHTTPRIHECGPEEMREFLTGRSWKPRHMQKAVAGCGSRERRPMGLVVKIDGRAVMSREITPSGWRHDAAIFVFEKFFVDAGTHTVEVAMRDDGKQEGDYPYAMARELTFHPRGVIAVDFEKPRFTARQ